MQSLLRDRAHCTRFLAVDLERRAIVSEASGAPLTHWLSAPTGELEHPFQRSSELIRLILACLKLLAQLNKHGIVHGGLRPDTLILKQNERDEIDYGSLCVIDFSVARTARDRIEKPLFIDLDSPDATYLSPAMREAIQKDFNQFARICGEPTATNWKALSSSAWDRYESVLMPDLTVNSIDWRSDLHALGHWFRQISLHRIDYYKDVHQEQLPSLIRKMQKSVLHGGYSSLDACIKAFESLEISPETFAVAAPPPTGSIVTMHPMPALRSGSDPLSPPPAMAPAAARSSKVKRRIGDHLGYIATGTGILLVAGTVWMGGRTISQHTPNKSTEHTEIAQISSASAITPTVQEPAPVAADTTQPTAQTQPTPSPAAHVASKETAEAMARAAAGSKTADFDQTPLDELKTLAEGGNPAAQTQLGLRFRQGKGVHENNGVAVAWYQRAIQQDFAEAKAYLGFMYMTGRGVRKNDEEAARLSREAAESGITTGQYNLALMYLNGRGVSQDAVQAYKWMKRAAEHDDAAKERLKQIKSQLSPAELKKAEAS
ncbi:sel1 repeat family protein [Burkholderiaceae bacterium DAT-1]|nr:sel1 repeat family protein [Burkholderiaceae bacterium DAT-1]